MHFKPQNGKLAVVLGGGPGGGLGGWTAVFSSRLAKISRCSNDRVPGGQSGTTLADCRNHQKRSEWVVQILETASRSHFLRSLFREQKMDAHHPLVIQDGAHPISTPILPPCSIFFAPNPLLALFLTCPLMQLLEQQAPPNVFCLSNLL
jgi:hypothetical protein